MAKVDKICEKILKLGAKQKYDAVQKFDPLLPPRKASAQETWQDNN